MPVVEIHLIEGYTPDDKSRLAQGVTEAVRAVIPAPPEAVTVMMHTLPSHDYFRGGEPRQPAPALASPEQVVRQYLASMEARDLAAAKAHLAPDFTMQFPGAKPMHSLEGLITWAAPRYRFVKKSYERFDAAGRIVYCFGTLAGEWPDGTPFDGIRFIDRFEFDGDLIARQDVWNDIAERRP